MCRCSATTPTPCRSPASSGSKSCATARRPSMARTRSPGVVNTVPKHRFQRPHARRALWRRRRHASQEWQIDRLWPARISPAAAATSRSISIIPAAPRNWPKTSIYTATDNLRALFADDPDFAGNTRRSTAAPPSRPGRISPCVGRTGPIRMSPGNRRHLRRPAPSTPSRSAIRAALHDQRRYLSGHRHARHRDDAARRAVRHAHRHDRHAVDQPLQQLPDRRITMSATRSRSIPRSAITAPTRTRSSRRRSTSTRS